MARQNPDCNIFSFKVIFPFSGNLHLHNRYSCIRFRLAVTKVSFEKVFPRKGNYKESAKFFDFDDFGGCVAPNLVRSGIFLPTS